MPAPAPTPDNIGLAANGPVQRDGAYVQGLRVQAARCRRLADAILDRQTTAVLTAMAAEYEEMARCLEKAT
jgi:hypothetical protein